MNLKTFLLTRKNIDHWSAFIKKMESRDQLTEEEADDIEGRKAQVMVWIRELRNAAKKGLDGGDEIPGDMSASGAVEATSSASANG
jgi:hypothetical protein